MKLNVATVGRYVTVPRGLGGSFGDTPMMKCILRTLWQFLGGRTRHQQARQKKQRTRMCQNTAHLKKSSNCTDYLNCLLKSYLIQMYFRILEFLKRRKMLYECNNHLDVRKRNTGERFKKPQKAAPNLVTDGSEYVGGLTSFLFVLGRQFKTMLFVVALSPRRRHGAL